MLHLPFVTGSTSTHDDCTSSMREATTSRVEMYVERDMVSEVEAGRVSRRGRRSRERRGKVKKGRRLLLKQSLSVASREPGTSSGSDRSLD